MTPEVFDVSHLAAEMEAEFAQISEGMPAVMANRVIADARSMDSLPIGIYSAAYDGTMEDAAAKSQLLRSFLGMSFGTWSNMETRTAATDERGRPKWAISPNGRNFTEL